MVCKTSWKTTDRRSVAVKAAMFVAWTCFGIFIVSSLDASPVSSIAGNALERNEKREEECSLPKRILFWTTFWKEQSFGWENIFFRQVSRKCPESRCELVYNHRLLTSADAVVFHTPDLHPGYQLPPRHSSSQIWIFFSLEAPPTVINDQNVDLKRLAGVFNWTMTYRRDSDVVVPYGRLVPNTPRLDATAPAVDYWATKSEKMLAAWMVSHCGTGSRREWFVKELVKHMRVDVYGRCGHKKCGKNLSFRNVGTFDQEMCNSEIQQYMFYLAFENSICEDYVTEKFYLPLTLDVVPVVFGGGNYADIAPPNSFINAMEFESPQDLAEYLKIVAANGTLYNNFFKWKDYYKVELGHPFSSLVCDLCAKLHDPAHLDPPNVTRSPMESAGVVGRVRGRDHEGSYPDIHGWFVTGSACRSWWQDSRDHRQHSGHT